MASYNRRICSLASTMASCSGDAMQALLHALRIQGVLGPPLPFAEQIDGEIERGLVEKGSGLDYGNRRVLREDAQEGFLRDIHRLIARSQLQRQKADEFVIVLPKQRKSFRRNLVIHLSPSVPTNASQVPIWVPAASANGLSMIMRNSLNSIRGPAAESPARRLRFTRSRCSRG